jgi:DNA-directed RNA polymerase specialized sigma24 family protein
VALPDSVRRSHEHFASTRWSIVLGAGGQISRVDARQALAALCQTYWGPLYAYLRRTGSSPADAEDTVQGFFGLLLERDDFARVHPQRGRFRSYLLAALKHYLANERDKQAAQKRGGGRIALSLDLHAAEDRYKIEPIDNRTPDALFDRYWALTVLERTTSQLRESYTAANKLDKFEILSKYLAGEHAISYQQAASQLRMSEGAVKAAVHRLRKEYGRLLRAEIAQTLPAADNVDDEIQALFEALRN